MNQAAETLRRRPRASSRPSRRPGSTLPPATCTIGDGCWGSMVRMHSLRRSSCKTRIRRANPGCRAHSSQRALCSQAKLRFHCGVVAGTDHQARRASRADAVLRSSITPVFGGPRSALVRVAFQRRLPRSSPFHGKLHPKKMLLASAPRAAQSPAGTYCPSRRSIGMSGRCQKASESRNSTMPMERRAPCGASRLLLVTRLLRTSCRARSLHQAA